MAASQNPPIKELKRWLRKHADRLLDHPTAGLLGIGIGKKSAGPLDDDSPFTITGYVRRKLSKRELRAQAVTAFADSIAAVTGIDPGEAGIDLDLVEAGSRFSAQTGLRIPRSRRGSYGGAPPALDLQKRFEAIRIGIGITNPEKSYPGFLSVGTLGFFVADEKGRHYLVSNNHVIAGENAAAAGNAVVQPGTLDLTETELGLLDTLAKLKKELGIAVLSAWVEIGIHGEDGIPLNDVDCALAELNGSRLPTELARVGMGGVMRGLGPAYAIDNATGKIKGSTRVSKAGRTTGWTEGDVTALNVVSDVEYAAGFARFRNQISIQATVDNGGPFSGPGDSGSAILDTDHRLVGLLFAGSESVTLANPIRPVLSGLETALGRGRLTLVHG